MAYSEQVLHRARARLEQAKAEREQENAAHRADAYARYPRLAEIDNELRRTMAELMAAALQRGVFGSLQGRRVKAESSETLRRKKIMEKYESLLRTSDRKELPEPCL